MLSSDGVVLECRDYKGRQTGANELKIAAPRQLRKLLVNLVQPRFEER